MVNKNKFKSKAIKYLLFIFDEISKIFSVLFSLLKNYRTYPSRKLKRWFANKIYDKTKNYKSLHSIKDFTTFKIYRLYRNHQRKILNYDLLENILSYIFLFPFSFLWYLIYLGAPFILSNLFEIKYSDTTWLVIYFLYLSLLFIIIKLTDISLSLLKSNNKFISIVMFIFGITIIILLYNLLSKNNLQILSLKTHVIMSLFLFLISTYVLIVITFIFTSLIRIIIYGYKNIVNPESLIINEIINIVEMIEKNSNFETEIKLKNELIRRIEKSACLLDRMFKIRFRSGDFITNKWITEFSLKVSSSLRDKKKCIIAPHENTKEELLKYFSNFYKNFITGNWQSIEKSETADIIKPKIIFSNILSILIHIIIAMIPITLFYIIQKTKYAISKNLFDYLLIGSLIWIIVTLLRLIDPQLNERIRIIKDVIDILPNLLKKGLSSVNILKDKHNI